MLTFIYDDNKIEEAYDNINEVLKTTEAKIRFKNIKNAVYKT